MTIVTIITIMTIMTIITIMTTVLIITIMTIIIIITKVVNIIKAVKVLKKDDSVDGRARREAHKPSAPARVAHGKWPTPADDYHHLRYKVDMYEWICMRP